MTWPLEGIADPMSAIFALYRWAVRRLQTMMSLLDGVDDRAIANTRPLVETLEYQYHEVE